MTAEEWILIRGNRIVLKGFQPVPSVPEAASYTVVLQAEQHKPGYCLSGDDDGYWVASVGYGPTVAEATRDAFQHIKQPMSAEIADMVDRVSRALHKS